MYHKTSFLAGLALGRELKGWGGSGGGGLAPLCWNDPGVYDCFYIDYRYGLGHVSLGRFCSQTVLFGGSGEIRPVEVEAVDGHTVRVWAELAGEATVRIYGSGRPGLAYADGHTVGPWAAELWPHGTAPHALPYLADHMAAGALHLAAEERAAFMAAQGAQKALREQAAYDCASVRGGEGAAIQYS